MNAAAAALPVSTPTPAPERAVRACERAFDRFFGLRGNPLRQLGALTLWMLWIVVASGFYVYVFYETSVADAWRSTAALGDEQPLAGGLMRSLHRLASDAFLLLMVVHLVREWALGRFRGFRWFTWVSGVPLPWLAVISGLVGYWMAWDERALAVGTATLEWLGLAPGVGEEAVRNFVQPEALGDRFFSLLAFVHIGVPLLLLLGVWAHLLRLVRPQVMPERTLTWASLGVLAAWALAWPARSMAQADLYRIPRAVEFDWITLGVLPLADAAPLATAVALGAATLALMLLPWWPRSARARERAAAAAQAPAVVDPGHCNGCTHCFADCPFGAIRMVAHADGRLTARMAEVDAALCAGCGICAGACPSATPFRRGAPLATGIDLPGLPLATLRARLDEALDALESAPAPRVLVLGCREGAQPASWPEGSTGVAALCSAQWPPAFVEYALRRGADGVLVTGCPDGDCAFRLGARWTAERIDGERLPQLRAQVERGRVRLQFALREHADDLDAAVRALRHQLSRTEPAHA